MGKFVTYTFASGLILLLLYIVYKWLLSAENQPRLNRLTLLMIYLVAFIMPLLPDFAPSIVSSMSSVSGLVEVGTPIAIKINETATGFNFSTLILWIYLGGAAIVCIFTLSTAAKLYKMVRVGAKERKDGITVVRIPGGKFAPFSWGRFIVITDDDDKAASMIELHERAHINAGHFIDLILSQLSCILLWYNPASWLMQSELKAVHEYQADEAVLKSGCNARDYQLLLIKKTVGRRFPSLANSLNHSKLKKRMTMMYSKKSSVARRTRVFALVPAAVFGLLLLNVPTVSEAMAIASNAQMDMSSFSNSKVTTNTSLAQADPDESATAPEQLPQFKGGIQAMFEYLAAETKYPKEAEDAKEEGKVVVKFTITDKGGIADVDVVKSVSPSLDAEAVRVVKSMTGKWIPGKDSQNKAVSVQYTIPVSFKLK